MRKSEEKKANAIIIEESEYTAVLLHAPWYMLATQHRLEDSPREDDLESASFIIKYAVIERKQK